MKLVDRVFLALILTALGSWLLLDGMLTVLERTGVSL